MTWSSCLRKERADLRVLFMSGYIDDALLRPGTSEAREAFLQKPFTLPAFVSKVREILIRNSAAPPGTGERVAPMAPSPSLTGPKCSPSPRAERLGHILLAVDADCELARRQTNAWPSPRHVATARAKLRVDVTLFGFSSVSRSPFVRGDRGSRRGRPNGGALAGRGPRPARVASSCAVRRPAFIHQGDTALLVGNERLHCTCCALLFASNRGQAFNRCRFFRACGKPWRPALRPRMGRARTARAAAAPSRRRRARPPGPRRVYGCIGHRNADQVNQREAKADGDWRETGRGTAVGGAHDNQQEHGREHDLRDHAAVSDTRPANERRSHSRQIPPRDRSLYVRWQSDTAPRHPPPRPPVGRLCMVRGPSRRKRPATTRPTETAGFRCIPRRDRPRKPS